MSDVPKAFEGVSDRAKAVFAVWFGMMSPKSGQLRFAMVENRPSDEAQAGLDELVQAELISREDDRGAVVYRPLVDGYPMFGWLYPRREEPQFSFPLTTPLTDRKTPVEIVVSRPKRRRKSA